MKRLREHAVHAMRVRDLDPEYGDKLVAEAIELEDQAKAIEEAAKKNDD